MVAVTADTVTVIVAVVVVPFTSVAVTVYVVLDVGDTILVETIPDELGVPADQLNVNGAQPPLTVALSVSSLP
jgi:hypothetical protein